MPCGYYKSSHDLIENVNYCNLPPDHHMDLCLLQFEVTGYDNHCNHYQWLMLSESSRLILF